jgi:D-threonate/D-erythronate kinase
MTVNSNSALPSFAVIADDLSGAMDTGVQFAHSGLYTLLVFDETVPLEAQAIIYNTDSRSSSKEAAAKHVIDAVKVLRKRNIFKKIDSTLRGHVSLEIRVLLDQLGQSSAVVCPAVPAQRRQVRDGNLWVEGKKLHETGFASDPNWPSQTSDVIVALGGQGQHFPIEIVRSGKLLGALQSSRSTFLVPDAWDENDLQLIADATVAAGMIPCGAAGFAHAWLQAILGRSIEVRRCTWCGIEEPILMMIGSFHPQARRQINQITICAGLPCYEIVIEDQQTHASLRRQVRNALWKHKGAIVCSPHTPIIDVTTRLRIQAQLADLAQGCVKYSEIGALILCGGDTAQAVLTRLEPDGILICGEIVSGVTYGILSGGCKPGLPILTKPGSWGDDNVFVELIKKLRIGLDENSTN